VQGDRAVSGWDEQAAFAPPALRRAADFGAAWEALAAWPPARTPGANVLALLRDRAAVTALHAFASAPAGGDWRGARSAPSPPFTGTRALRSAGLLCGAHGTRPTRHARLLGALKLLLKSAGQDGAAMRGADVARALLADVALLAPAMPLPSGVSGEFALFVAGGSEPGRLLRLHACGESLHVVARQSGEAVSGFMVASAQVWLRALLTGAGEGVSCAGDVRALAAVVAVLAAGTRPPEASLALTSAHTRLRAGGGGWR
jgi:hypothetical protein